MINLYIIIIGYIFMKIDFFWVINGNKFKLVKYGYVLMEELFIVLL